MTKPGDSQTKKTIRELAKEFPDKTYNELEKYKDADRIEEADSIPLTQAQENLVEHITADDKKQKTINRLEKEVKLLEEINLRPNKGIPSIWERIDAGKLSNRGDSLHEFPTYIKHWESAKPWGWELRILTEDGLHILHLKWKDYKRPREVKDV
jgi:hypothetical protein